MIQNQQDGEGCDKPGKSPLHSEIPPFTNTKSFGGSPPEDLRSATQGCPAFRDQASVVREG